MGARDMPGAYLDRHAAHHQPRPPRRAARWQQLVRINDEDEPDLTASDAARISGAVEDAIADADALILEDYNKGVLIPAVITRAIEAPRARKTPVVVDPKYRHFFAYRG